MNPYALEKLTGQQTADARGAAARRRATGSRISVIRHRTGWALIQIGLALVTSRAERRSPAALGPGLR